MTTKKLFDLTGRVALVTGGSRGIGRATCVALAQQGAYVAVNYLSNEAAANEALEAVRAVGGEGELLPFDAADPEAITKAVDDLGTRKGGLHIAVANAGIAVDGLLLRLKNEDLERTMRVNALGPVYLARAAVRLMLRQKWGRIVFLTSVVGDAGNAGQSAYAASKGALNGVVRSLAKELGSRTITVNAVSPGFIDTDMTARIPAEAREGLVKVTPIARLGKAEEVAAAVAYLSSDEAGFVTGQTLRVNGGLYV